MWILQERGKEIQTEGKWLELQWYQSCVWNNNQLDNRQGIYWAFIPQFHACSPSEPAKYPGDLRIYWINPDSMITINVLVHSLRFEELLQSVRSQWYHDWPVNFLEWCTLRLQFIFSDEGKGPMEVCSRMSKKHAIEKLDRYSSTEKFQTICWKVSFLLWLMQQH